MSFMKTTIAFQAVLTLILATAHADTPPTHAAELEANFNAASQPLSVQDFVGNYLGRCFDSTSDTPEGMILSTVQKQIGADEGPLFPSSSTYNMSTIEATNPDLTAAPATSNDTITQASIDAYWANTTVISGGVSYPIQYANIQIEGTTALEVGTLTDTADSKTITAHVYLRVRKGADGYLYSRTGTDSNGTGTVVSSDVNKDQYCYFWQKLTPQ